MGTLAQICVTSDKRLGRLVPRSQRYNSDRLASKEEIPEEYLRKNLLGGCLDGKMEIPTR